MWDPSHNPTLSCFRRANGLPDRTHLPTWHAGRPHSALPMRPWLLREGLAKDRKQLLAPPDTVRPGRIGFSRRQVGAIKDLRHQALKNLVVAAVDIERSGFRLEHARGTSVRA